MSADRMTLDIEVEGLARPVSVTFGLEPPDYSVGISGGWYLAEAEIAVPGHPRMYLDADGFEYLFGRLALQVAEENAADYASGRPCDLPDREEEEA